MSRHRAPHPQAGEFVNIQFAVLVGIQPVKPGCHEIDELLFGDLAVPDLIHQQQQLFGVGIRGLQFGIGSRAAPATSNEAMINTNFI
jgi:hypothetical protein